MMTTTPEGGGHYDLISPRYLPSREDEEDDHKKGMMKKKKMEDTSDTTAEEAKKKKDEEDDDEEEEGKFELAPEIVRALTSGGLEKYMDIFTQEEIDLESFLLLNDTDLRHMNIPTGPRKKILKKIQSLREKHPGLLSSSPGASSPSFNSLLTLKRSPASSQSSSLSSSLSITPPSPSALSARASPLLTPIPSSTPPSPSPLAFAATPASHYSGINDDDLTKGRSLSIDTLGSHAVREPQQLKRFMSSSPTTPRFGMPASSVSTIVPSQSRSDGNMEPPDVQQRKFSLPSAPPQTSGDVDDQYAMMQGRRQRAFALSYQPKDSVPTSGTKPSASTSSTSTTMTMTKLSSAASYSVAELQQRTRGESEIIKGGQGDQAAAPMSSSVPLRSYFVRERIDSRILRAKWEIDFDELVLDEKIGSGNFGIVYKAKWRNSPCVVKMLKEKAISEKQLQEFREESRVWMNIRPHANVVQFLGACSKAPNICLITEYLPLGDARSLIRTQTISLKSKLHMLLGIAAGMCHLHREQVVHRDLACRNVMVTKNINGEYDAKVGDFGLSKLGAEGIYASSTGVGPLKWMPPESINPHQRIFSNKSDVWSFGVVVWEMLMDGEEPFGNDDAVTAGLRILKGDRLQLPAFTPPTLAALVHDCWNEKDEMRPGFDEICKRMQYICASYIEPTSLDASKVKLPVFGKTLAELEGAASSDAGPKRASEMVELAIKKGIIRHGSGSPEPIHKPPVAAANSYGSIGHSASSLGGNSYSAIGQQSAPFGGTAATIVSSAATSVAAESKLKPEPTSGRLSPRPKSPTFPESEPAQGVGRPRPKSIAFTSEGAASLAATMIAQAVQEQSKDDDNRDWRYRSHSGGTSLSGKAYSPSGSGDSKAPASSYSPSAAKSTGWCVAGGARRGRESTGMIVGQRRLSTALGLNTSYSDGSFALLSEREIFLVISYLDIASLCRLSATSRQWRQLYYSPALWRFLFKKRQRSSADALSTIRRRRRSTMPESGEVETLAELRRGSYHADKQQNLLRDIDAELFSHFVTKVITRSMVHKEADTLSSFNWHRLFVTYFEPCKISSSGQPSASSNPNSNSNSPVMSRKSSVPPITIGQRTLDLMPFRIGMYGMEGVDVASLATLFLEQCQPHSRSGSGNGGSGNGSPRKMPTFTYNKHLDQAIQSLSVASALATSSGIGLVQKHAVQSLGDVIARPEAPLQQGEYRAESDVDGQRSFFNIQLATFLKDNGRFQKAADRELFCLCYDPNDLSSFFFIISLCYELFEERDGHIFVPPLFLVARSSSAPPPSSLTSSWSSTSDRIVTTREGKMLASILCCPFFSISLPNPTSTEASSQDSASTTAALQLLFHSMAREVRLSREGYATRFYKPGNVAPASPKPTHSVQRHSVRESQGGRAIVVRGDVYLGQASERNEERSGVGMAWMKDTREIYVGEWLDDKPHGWGVLYSPQEGRRMWAGSWMAGRPAVAPSNTSISPLTLS